MSFCLVVPVTMPEKKEGTIYGAVVAFVAVLIVVFILVFLYRRHLKKKYALYLEPNENFVVRSVLVQCCY